MALMKVDKAMYWALLLLCAWVGAHLASAIDAECSACEAVAVSAGACCIYKVPLLGSNATTREVPETLARAQKRMSHEAHAATG